MTTTRSGFTKLAAVCIAILLGAVVWELDWPLTRAEHEWSRLIAAVATLGHLRVFWVPISGRKSTALP